MTVKNIQGFWDARGGTGPIKITYYVHQGEAILSAGRIGYASSRTPNLASFTQHIFHYEYLSGQLSKQLNYGSNKNIKIATTGNAVNPVGGNTVKIYVSISRGGSIVPFKIRQTPQNSNSSGGFDPIFLDKWKIPISGNGNAQTVFRIKT